MLVRRLLGNGLGLFCLGSFPKDGVEVYVAPGRDLFAREAVYGFVIWDHSGVKELQFLISGPVEDVN